MNVKRYLLATLGVFAVTFVSDFIGHSLFLAETYKSLSDLFVGQGSPGILIFFEFIHALLFTFIFTKTFHSWKKGVPGGVTYGLLMQLFLSVPAFVYDHIFIKGFPVEVAAYWVVIALFMGFLQGIAVGLIYKK